jgi:citrate synthase
MTSDASGGFEVPLSETVDDRIKVRGRDLADELVGRLSLTEAMLLDLHGVEATPGHVRMVDAILVALMEHGITPSTLAARLVLDGAPESPQGALAAGLLAVGSRFLGVVDASAALLQHVIADGGELRAAAGRRVAAILAAGDHVPGLGHNLHGNEDPRVPVLREIAEREGIAGPHVRAQDAVATAFADQTGRTLIVNAAGIAGAILSDLGYAPQQIRGFSLVARAAGLFAHLVDEQRRPIARTVWEGQLTR